VVSELVQRCELEPKEIDQIVFGAVIPVVQWPNIAREVGLAAGLPKNIEAYSVARACATSLQALTAAADAIATGEVDVAVVGGAEAMSVPSRRDARTRATAIRARRLRGQLRAQGFAARCVREAQAGLRQEVRKHHRRQLVSADRRRGRPGRHGRGEGARAGDAA